MAPPVRELLSSFLLKRQETILRRLLTHIQQAPDLEPMWEMVRTEEYRQAVGTLLHLSVRNIADSKDRRCFHYARQRAQERFRQNIPATHMLRLAAIHRQILSKMVQKQFGAEASMTRRMIELIETQMGELEIAFAEAYQTERDRQWQTSETKYFSLFENASEAIISFRPGTGSISEVNVQAERLLARPRNELLDTNFLDLFPDEHAEEVRWLIEQSGGSANVRLEDMTIRRQANAAHPGAARGDDGSKSEDSEEETNAESATLWVEVPISLSCNWISVDGSPVAQAILRDVTQLRQMQRELQSYAEQLEERVAVRTGELQHSEARFRALFLQEQRRAQHLSLINEVQRAALDMRDIEEFLHSVTHAVQGHFRDCDVTFFVIEGQRDAVLDQLRPTDPTATAQADDNGNYDSGNVAEADQSTSIGPGHHSNGRHSDGPHATGHHPDAEFSSADLIAVVQAGGHGLAVPPGSRHPAGLGLPGQAAARGETLHYALNATNSGAANADDGGTIESHHDANGQLGEWHAEWRARPPGVYREARSEMGVPVQLEGQTVGVLCVQSEESAAFDERDAVALQTVAAILSSHLAGSRLFREMGELNQFNQTLINTMLHSLMVIDRFGRVQMVNERLLQTLRLSREELIGHPLTCVFGENVVHKYRLDETIAHVTGDGTPREVPEVQLWTHDANVVFDLRLFRVYFRGEAQAVVLAINITQRWRKTHQLQLMHEMGRFFQASLDINKVLYTVLTCITAGSALGFNRAFLLLRSSDKRLQRSEDPSFAGTTLTGVMALGPSSAEEAGHIWSEISHRDTSLQEILSHAGQLDGSPHTPLQKSTSLLTIDLDNPAFDVFSQAVREGQAISVRLSELFAPTHDLTVAQRAQLECARALLTAPEIAVAPLLAKDRVVGVVLADNLYSGASIDADDIQLLDTLAQQAGLTIDNALTYQALQKAQRELVSAERLAAVGEMAARVSHEIRNPLATVGGFARSVLKKPDDETGVTRKTQIIVNEVTRLEELLSDLLDMARPRALNLEPQDINAIVDHAILLASADIKGLNVTVQKDFVRDLSPVLVDRSRLLQALLNTIRNGAQAMPQGGVLEIATRVPHRSDTDQSTLEQVALFRPLFLEIEVKDHGIGISERAVKQIFDPFFSTKVSGSGLGLPITRRIVQDHGGDIDVFSQEGQGTTFIICLPLRMAFCPVIYDSANAD